MTISAAIPAAMISAPVMVTPRPNRGASRAAAPEDTSTPSVFLKEHTEIRNKLENTLRKKMGIPLPNAASAVPAPSSTAPCLKPAVQAAAAAASSAGKPRPTR